MTTHFLHQTVRKAKAHMVQATVAGGITAGTLLIPAAAQVGHIHHDGSNATSDSKLVEIVRNSTRQYQDVNAAVAAKYQPLFGCVTGHEAHAIPGHQFGLNLKPQQRAELIAFLRSCNHPARYWLEHVPGRHTPKPGILAGTCAQSSEAHVAGYSSQCCHTLNV